MSTKPAQPETSTTTLRTSRSPAAALRKNVWRVVTATAILLALSGCASVEQEAIDRGCHRKLREFVGVFFNTDMSPCVYLAEKFEEARMRRRWPAYNPPYPSPSPAPILPPGPVPTPTAPQVAKSTSQPSTAAAPKPKIRDEDNATLAIKHWWRRGLNNLAHELNGQTDKPGAHTKAPESPPPGADASSSEETHPAAPPTVSAQEPLQAPTSVPPPTPVPQRPVMPSLPVAAAPPIIAPPEVVAPITQKDLGPLPLD